MSEYVPEYLGSSIDAFTATPQGYELLESSTELQLLTRAYCETKEYAEDLVTSSGSEIGIGGSAELRCVAGVAIKASTPTSGKYKSGSPENLVRQSEFLNKLGADLAARGHRDITVPEQYFGLRTASGNTLLAQEYMEGWQSLEAWLKEYGYTQGNRYEIASPVTQRLKHALGDSALKYGVRDLIVHGTVNRENVLVPKDSDPVTAPLCIIDQHPYDTRFPWFQRRFSSF